MTRERVLAAAAIATALLSSAVWAHHSRGNFALDDVVELHGVITEYSWRNPHTFVTLAVENDAGETEEWLLELNSISVLTGTGWNRDTVKVGDEVTVFGNPDLDRSKKLFFSNYFVLPDGSRMVSAPNFSRGVPIARPAAREIDTTAISDDFSGIWRRQRGFRGGGGGMGMGGNAGATGPSLGGQAPASGLPLTARGEAELAAYDVADNPFFRCEAESLPGVIDGTQEIIRDSDDEIVIRYEIMEVERRVHLGMTGHPSNTRSSHLGHSIGWMEDETLVVDTAFFTPADWGIGSGVSSSERKHVVERYTLTNGGNGMRVEYTIEDPAYLAEPVRLSSNFFLDRTYPWTEYNCDANASNRHLTVE